MECSKLETFRIATGCLALHLHDPDGPEKVTAHAGTRVGWILAAGSVRTTACTRGSSRWPYAAPACPSSAGPRHGPGHRPAAGRRPGSWTASTALRLTAVLPASDKASPGVREGSGGAARRRTQSPGGERDHAEDSRCHDVAGTVMHRNVEGDRPGIDEDQAGVGPLLESGEAGDEQRHQGECLRDSQDGEEVVRKRDLVKYLPDVVISREVPLDPYGRLREDRQRDDPIDDAAR